MSGLVQPAGDASIDLGSDLTPGPPSSALLLGKPRLPPSSPLASSRSHPCLFLEVAETEGGRESAGRQGLGVRNGGEVDTRRAEGRHEGGWRTSKSGLPELAPSATHVHSHLLHLRPPPLTLDTLQWCSSSRLNPCRKELGDLGKWITRNK